MSIRPSSSPGTPGRPDGSAANGKAARAAAPPPAAARVSASLPGRLAASPIVARRQLARELRRLREQTGQSEDAVAKALYWSPSKISKYERGRTIPVPAELVKLLDYLGIAGRQHADLLQLAQTAHQATWLEAAQLPARQREFIGLEHDAAEILIWQQHVMPALLQTEAYARHAVDTGRRIEPASPRQASRLVAITLQRQQLLTRQPPPRITVVLDEALLHRPAGGAAVMREQLAQLARLAGHPAITVHILPVTRPQPVLTGSFTILGYGPEDHELLPDVAALDHIGGGLLLENEHETYLYRLAFQALAAESLDPSQSRALLDQLAAASASPQPAAPWPRAASPPPAGSVYTSSPAPAST